MIKIKKEFYTIENKITIENDRIITGTKSFMENIKDKLLSVMAAFYIYGKFLQLFEKHNNSLFYLIFTSIIYVIIGLFTLYLFYYSWLSNSWTNKVKIENLTKITLTNNEDCLLNIDLELKEKFLTTSISFRKTEKEYEQFLTFLRKRNSKFILNDRRKK